ncbi:MAG TPA: hypothetical protein PKE03_09825 [Bacteroidales bacterium]|nr:hypothetical protein [Bacteroidales bacterium]
MEWLFAISPLEWLGYAASVVVAVSLALSSVVRFRIINLIGAAMFSAYGFIIGAYPVGVMNGLIVLLDLYYLVKIFGAKEVFEVLEIQSDSRYLQRFLQFHQQDIKRFFPNYHFDPLGDKVSFFVLRNMEVAGVFAGNPDGKGGLKVNIDYVIPRFRDFKNGRFVYGHLGGRLAQIGIKSITSRPSAKPHEKYLRRMGFEAMPDGSFLKSI